MKNLLVFVLLVLHSALIAQVDFNNYQPLKSVGPVPTDFSTPTRLKVKQSDKERLKDLSAKERSVFVEEVNYAIDELLKSGKVTFGDPVSQYIQTIGNRLTNDSPELKGKLRFYAYNTNEANAFSTDQGMVFVTTGLIAQMTNEAQLAFVLAHEIVHYQEKHVLDLYDYSTSNKKFSYNEKVRLFSKYSRDNEFEADQKAVKMVHMAGYTNLEINKTFDVLMYSYLPFEELPFDVSYFNNEMMFVPLKATDIQRNEITAKSFYNDRFNSHPNIQKRKDELDKEIAKFADWGSTLNYDEKLFQEIRTICRFEFVLNDVYDLKNIDALYSIYILEKQFPQSRFLKNCKSQVWLEMMKYTKRSNSGMNYGFGASPYYDSYGYEGNISILSRLIGGMDKEQKVAFGLRIIRDNYLKDTMDQLATKMWDKAIEFAAYNKDFEVEQFSKMTFHQAIERFRKQKAENDSIKEVAEHTSYLWDKYQTIKNLKSGITEVNQVDSSKFYLYGISDLIKDQAFNARLLHFKNKLKNEESEEDAIFEMTDEELDNYYQNENKTALHIGMDSVLMINPFVFEIVGYKRLDYKKSDELEAKFLKSVASVANSYDLNIKQLDRSEQQALTADDYNRLSQLLRSLEKRVDNRGINAFMLDLEALHEIQKHYGSKHLMLMDLQHTYDSGIGVGNGVLFTVLFPIGMVYFPIAILSGHETELNAYVMDLDDGKLVIDKNYYANEPASEKFLKLRLDALFHQLKQVKKDAQ